MNEEFRFLTATSKGKMRGANKYRRIQLALLETTYDADRYRHFYIAFQYQNVFGANVCPELINNNKDRYVGITLNRKSHFVFHSRSRTVIFMYSSKDFFETQHPFIQTKRIYDSNIGKNRVLVLIWLRQSNKDNKLFRISGDSRIGGFEESYWADISKAVEAYNKLNLPLKGRKVEGS